MATCGRLRLVGPKVRHLAVINYVSGHRPIPHRRQAAWRYPDGHSARLEGMPTRLASGCALCGWLLAIRDNAPWSSRFANKHLPAAWQGRSPFRVDCEQGGRYALKAREEIKEWLVAVLRVLRETVDGLFRIGLVGQAQYASVKGPCAANGIALRLNIDEAPEVFYSQSRRT